MRTLAMRPKLPGLRLLRSAPAMLLVASAGEAATGCALRWKTDCSLALPRYGCQMGCDNPLPLQPSQGRFFAIGAMHDSGASCISGGSFQLASTQYAQPCATPPDCLPPLRFWDHDNFGGAAGGNSGCTLLEQPQPWITWQNAGRWQLESVSWNGPYLDGCPTGRAVVEVSDVDAAQEGTAAHSSWYLVASVEADRGAWDLSQVRGALPLGGCNDADVPSAPVPALTIQGRSASCTSSAVASGLIPNVIDPSFGDVDILIANPYPDWFSELGRSTLPALIAGFQVMVAGGSEPTTSDAAAGAWLPVRDPADPSRALGVIPIGTSTAVRVAVPRSGLHWLALRLVYHAGAAVNPLGSFDPTLEPGPQVVSHLGSHCGPVGVAAPCTVATLPRVDALVAVRRGSVIDFTWAPPSGGREVHVNAVLDKLDLLPPGPHLPDLPGGLATLACTAMAPAVRCSDGASLGLPGPRFFRALLACGSGGQNEGPED